MRKFSFQGKEHYVFRVYEADYQIADLYEAWALYHFGTLVVSVVSKEFRTISSHRVFGAGAQIRACKSGSVRHEIDIEKQRRELEDSLHESLQKLTMQGILPFVFCCAAQSLYGLALPVLQTHVESFAPSIWEAVKDSELRMHDFFLGMGAVASTAAISNIIRVERIFHHQLLDFKPFWKFWGTKVLVSIAFLQALVFKLPIPPFQQMSQVHTSLMYSSMLCYECFGVALLHMYAWSAQESWYGDGAIGFQDRVCGQDQEECNPLSADYAVTPSKLGRASDSAIQARLDTQDIGDEGESNIDADPFADEYLCVR